RGPLLVRFPHLVQKQIKSLFDAFSLAIKEYQYSGAFKAVFPLKVNQMPSFVLPLVQGAKGLNYGLEARSKSELIIAMSYTNPKAPITANGFKDKEMIELGFIAKSMQ
ncbi:arginine decarboxylase, partial [Staphylococcus pseudintermedius]